MQNESEELSSTHIIHQTVQPLATNEEKSKRIARPCFFASTVLAAAAREYFLQAVFSGEQDHAEEMLKTNPKLALHSGRIIDLSGRIFTNITGFQYAVWALDFHMYKMISKYLPASEALRQCNHLEKIGTTHGKCFNVQPLINLLDEYIKAGFPVKNKNKKDFPINNKNKKNCPVHNREDLLPDDDEDRPVDDSMNRAFWCKKIGGLQRMLTVCFINEYCRPDRAFNPRNPECRFSTDTLPRVRTIHATTSQDEWFTALYKENGEEDGREGGLGDTFAIYRAGRDQATAASHTRHLIAYDRDSLQALFDARLLARGNFIASLKKPVSHLKRLRTYLHSTTPSTTHEKNESSPKKICFSGGA